MNGRNRLLVLKLLSTSASEGTEDEGTWCLDVMWGGRSKARSGNQVCRRSRPYGRSHCKFD